MSTGMLIFAIASAPLFFFPTIAAYMNRKRHAHAYAAVNVLFAAYLVYNYYAIESRNLPVIPGPGALVGWLILLGLTIRKDSPRAQDIDEPVELVPYDPSWPEVFEEERRRLVDALGLDPAGVEHIGSTAVPGMLAKPVIDIMLGVPRLPPRNILSRLTILGYENFGEAGVPGRIYLRLREAHKINLHVVERGGVHWTNNLALRELLRRDAGARERYAAAKQAALANGGDRLLAYSAAKQGVIEDLQAQARKA